MIFSHKALSDPMFVAENRMSPHSDHRWFSNFLELESGFSSFEQCLDGAWKFAYARNPRSVPDGFESPEFDTDGWEDIRVPGHIQMQGYGTPQYANVQYPWDGHEELEPGTVSESFNPTACYVKDFVMERDPQPGDRISIQFGGAESAIALWCNGEYVGFSADSFTPAEFDLTDLLRPGCNRVAAQVFRWCGGSWLEDQDFFRFSGLFRSVIIRTRPPAHVQDIRIGVDVAENLDAATIKLHATMLGAGSINATFGAYGAMSGLGGGSFEITVQEPHLWSSEDPHLESLTLEVLDERGKVVEVIRQQVGIRRFEIDDGIMKINGMRIVFKGVNRHEFGPHGRVMTRGETEADIIALKRLGVNAIRTSHYPNNSFFYELCDKYGLYVIDEMNLETHGIWEKLRFHGLPISEAVPGDNPVWMPALMDRAASMYERDKNHPSIVIWSCGNESFGGKNILEVSNFFRGVDVRPVHYEGVHWDPRYPETTDIVSQMYTSAADVEQFLGGNRDKPMILCEYAHVMGNSFGAVDKYMDLAYKDRLFQGGFIWDFADQALPLVDKFGNEYFGYGGDFGEAPHDGDFSGNGIFFADHTPKPLCQEVKHVYRGIQTAISAEGIWVTNRMLFTNTSAFDCIVKIARNGTVVGAAPLETAVAPEQTEFYLLPMEIPNNPGEYTIDVTFHLRAREFWAESGFEIAGDQGIIQVGEPSVEPLYELPRIVDATHNIGIHGPSFSMIFSRKFGGPQSYVYAGKNLLKDIPKPNFWHAPTSNEKGWNGPFEDSEWLVASRYSLYTESSENPRLEILDDRAVVTYSYELPTVPPSHCEVAYGVRSDGHVRVTLDVMPGEDLGDMPEFGMLFKVSSDFDVLRWYGEGPEESYIDRRGGARVGIYETDVASQLTKYITPQEAGNHTGVRWAEVIDGSGRGLKFDCQPHMEFSALPASPFEIENATHPNELPPQLFTYIRPALMRRGVGGDDSWQARTHPEFLLPSGRQMKFTFGFQGM